MSNATSRGFGMSTAESLKLGVSLTETSPLRCLEQRLPSHYLILALTGNEFLKHRKLDDNHNSKYDLCERAAHFPTLPDDNKN